MSRVMMRGGNVRWTMLIALFVAGLVCLIARTASAQTASVEELHGSIESLARGPAGELAPDEIDRARDLLRMSSDARRAGNIRAADGLLAVIPLQIRLIREILRAVEAERAADGAEGELEEARRLARSTREDLDRTLELLLSLIVELMEE
jgi:hypothetical protein